MNSKIVQLYPWRELLLGLHEDGSISIVEISYAPRGFAVPYTVEFKPLYENR